MSTVKNGAVGWGDSSLGGGKSKNDFLRLIPGNNIIRLLTLPHQYHQHRYEPEGGKKYGYRINCSKSETEDKCPLCDMGNKAKRRWFIGVIDRKTGMYRTLDIGYSVFKSLASLSSGEWGSPEGYDVNIAVDPNGGATNYYFVSPMPPRALSADDIRIKEENPVKMLEEKTDPPTPASVQSRLDKIKEELDGHGGQEETAKSQPTATGKASSPAAEEEDDGDDFFKSYDKNKA